MKVDQGKLIYPRQIKKELGAKIIHDAICPVASKAFYGFNPYEKENYSNMVAEDIGNSYGRCNQIADASIEIEKKIKEHPWRSNNGGNQSLSRIRCEYIPNGI